MCEQRLVAEWMLRGRLVKRIIGSTRNIGDMLGASSHVRRK